MALRQIERHRSVPGIDLGNDKAFQPDIFTLLEGSARHSIRPEQPGTDPSFDDRFDEQVDRQNLIITGLQLKCDPGMSRLQTLIERSK